MGYPRVRSLYRHQERDGMVQSSIGGIYRLIIRSAEQWEAASLLTSGGNRMPALYRKLGISQSG